MKPTLPPGTPEPTPVPTPSPSTTASPTPEPTTSFVATPTPTLQESLDWSISLIAAAGEEGINQNLAFGTKPNTTDEFDAGLDMPHPPALPSFTFDAYFSSTSPLFPQLDKDYRAPVLALTDIRMWELTMKSASTDITLSWDISEIPPELEILVRTDTNVIDITTQSSMVIPAGVNIVTISASR